MISLKVLDSIDISIFIMEIHDIFFLFRPIILLPIILDLLYFRYIIYLVTRYNKHYY